jgi:ribosomal subunit interface protein
MAPTQILWKGVLMNLQFTFKGIDSSEALIAITIEKINSKISAFKSECITPRVTFSRNKDLWKIHFSARTSDGHVIDASHSGPNVYSELDIIAQRIETQLHRHKEKISSGKGNSGLSEATANWRAPARSMSWSEGSDDQGAVDAADVLKFETARRGAPWKKQG